MLSSSLDTLLKVFKTTYPKKTIRIWFRNAVYIIYKYMYIILMPIGINN